MSEHVVLMYFVAVFLFHLHLWNPHKFPSKSSLPPTLVPVPGERCTFDLRRLIDHFTCPSRQSGGWKVEPTGGPLGVIVYSSSSCRCSLQLLLLFLSLLLLLETKGSLNQTFQTRWRLSCDSKQAALKISSKTNKISMGKTNKRNFVIRYMPVPSSTPSQGCCVSPLPDQQPGNIGERYQKSKLQTMKIKKHEAE